MTERRILTMLEEIGLTDDYFKELLKTRKDYLLLLINSICNLELKEDTKN